MNKTKLRKLKKMLKTDKQVREGFYMPKYITTIDCKTVGCMAGWWAMKELGVKSNLELDIQAVDNGYNFASEYIGKQFNLDKRQSYMLFTPLYCNSSKYSNPDLAALAVQSLIDGATDPWEAANVRNSRA
jgi:hypothetical protein